MPFKEITASIEFVKFLLRMLTLPHSGCQLYCPACDDIHIRLNTYRIYTQPTWMLSPIPVSCFFTRQLVCPVVGKTQRMEQAIELLCVWEIKNEAFQLPGIFHCILNGIADPFYMKESLQVIKIGEEEIKEIVEITPLAEE